MSKKEEKELQPGSPKFKITPLSAMLIIWAVMIGAQYFYFNRNVESVAYTQFLKILDEGKIKSATLSDEAITAQLTDAVDGKKVIRTIPISDPNLTERLLGKNVEITGTPKGSFWSSISGWIFFIFLFYIGWQFLFRKMSPQGGLLNFGKSKAKIYMEKDIKTSFADVAGIDEAKDELIEIVNFLKSPDTYGRLGGRAPKGILLVGPPGTGKTLLARAVAGEASVPFFSINGSEFVEMFVGMGAARVRDLFEQARKYSPCIIFIDELDALGRSRATGPISGGGHDEKEQTLNQLLAELDGFDPSSGIVLLAATNRPEVLDPALLRAGRFDRQILVDKPDQAGREAILKIHAKKVRLGEGVDLKKIAELTPGFSGADLANLVNEAALAATRRDAESVAEVDFTYAIERIVAGLERKKRLMNPEEKKRVAYHEMGHATVALALDSMDRVHKISVIPRGIGALGYTLQRPTEDRYLMTKDELVKKIAVLLGGRASENVFFNQLSTGARDDLVKATNIARAMATQFAMSDQMGLMAMEQNQNRFLEGMGDAYSSSRMSENTLQKMDEATASFLNAAYEIAEESIRQNKDFIHGGVEHLLKTETLVEKDIIKMWAELGKKWKNLDRPLLPQRN